MQDYNTSPELLVRLQFTVFPSNRRRKIEVQARIETLALLATFPDQDIWTHTFKVDGQNYILSSRIAGQNGSGKIIADVEEAPDGLTGRTIMKARRPPAEPKAKSAAKASKQHKPN